MIAAVAAVVAKGCNDGGKLGVVGGDGTGIAQGTEILCRVEAMGGGMSEASRAACLECAAMCLGVVFDEFETMLPAYFSDIFGVGASSVEVDNHDGPGFPSDFLLDLRVVDL